MDLLLFSLHFYIFIILMVLLIAYIIKNGIAFKKETFIKLIFNILYLPFFFTIYYFVYRSDENNSFYLVFFYAFDILIIALFFYISKDEITFDRLIFNIVSVPFLYVISIYIYLFILGFTYISEFDYPAKLGAFNYPNIKILKNDPFLQNFHSTSTKFTDIILLSHFFNINTYIVYFQYKTRHIVFWQYLIYLPCYLIFFVIFSVSFKYPSYWIEYLYCLHYYPDLEITSKIKEGMSKMPYFYPLATLGFISILLFIPFTLLLFYDVFLHNYRRLFHIKE